MATVLLVDATSIFAFQQHLKAREYDVQGNPNYGALLDALSRRISGPLIGSRVVGRAATKFRTMLAFVAINPSHEGQQRFCKYLRDQGFIVDEADFRDAYVLPNRESQYQRLSSRLTYVAGMLTAPIVEDSAGGAVARNPPHLVVVTDAFDTYYPLMDYVIERGGEVTIAFFRNGMEERWERAGLFSSGSPIKFLDLSDDANAIIGIDLGSSITPEKGGKGLAGFKV